MKHLSVKHRSAMYLSVMYRLVKHLSVMYRSVKHRSVMNSLVKHHSVKPHLVLALVLLLTTPFAPLAALAESSVNLSAVKLPTANLSTANASTVSESAAGESTANVENLAGTCINCHIIDGQATLPSPIPSFANLSRDGLVNRLNAFKADIPPAGTTIMNRLAKGYTASQIEALATYLAQHNVQTVCCTPETQK